MPIELMLGMLIGGVIFIVAMLVRQFSRPIETEISPYVQASRTVSRSDFDSSAPVSYGDFSLTIDDIFSIRGRGTVVTGKVASGSLRLGQRVHVSSPDGTERYETTVRGIEIFKKHLEMAQTGDYVGLLLENLTKEQVKKGMVIKVLN
jgi:translation elongation factor EF-G